MEPIFESLSPVPTSHSRIGASISSILFYFVYLIFLYVNLRFSSSIFIY